MTDAEFKDVVRRVTYALVDRGYEVQEGSDPDTVAFQKTPVLGVCCLIVFEHLRYPDQDMFKVTLIRRRLTDFPVGEAKYKPLYLDLPNLMLGLYKKSIFRPGKYDWEFFDVAGLRRRLGDAQAYIIDYGIRWLEDPMSNIEWVKQRRGSQA